MITTSTSWFALLYPEKMSIDWQLRIGDLLQVPYAYVIHESDHDLTSVHRKAHVHVALVFPNITNHEHVFSVLNLLSSDGSVCCSTCIPLVSFRHVYDYLNADTDSSCILGNGFDTLL